MNKHDRPFPGEGARSKATYGPAPRLSYRAQDIGGVCAGGYAPETPVSRKMRRKPKDSIRKKPGPAPQERQKPKDSVRK